MSCLQECLDRLDRDEEFVKEYITALMLRSTPDPALLVKLHRPNLERLGIPEKPGVHITMFKALRRAGVSFPAVAAFEKTVTAAFDPAALQERGITGLY